eukprot:g5769.t1
MTSLDSNCNELRETCTLSSERTHGVPQDDTPVLAIYGKTRAGKGELISTAVRFLTGVELHITSSGMLSHTKTARGYPSKLNGMDIVFYDTVGFGDSECTNLAEDTLLRMLEATGTQPFYPPLYILKDLDSANIDALRKMTSIFPEVCVAVRGGEETFKAATNDFEEARIQVSEIFHLPEYLPSLPQTKGPYNSAVNRILATYSSFTPTRKDLKFDSEIFAGKVEKIKVKTETKYEDKIFEEHYTVTETQILNKERVENVLTGYQFEDKGNDLSNLQPLLNLHPATAVLGAAAQALGGHKKKKKVPTYTPVTLKDQVPVDIEVSRRKITTTRFSYARDINQVYKVLTGNIRIYMVNETGGWKETGQEIINIQDVKE